MKKNLGEMVYVLREKAGIAQKDLAEGLLSVPELSRVEKGERDEDKFVLTALFERLGKSLDKFEFLQTAEEYQMFFLRSLIEGNLFEGEYEAAIILLKEYRESACGKENLHRQYYCFMRALTYYFVEYNAAECLESLEEALFITHSNWKEEKWERIYFCEQEIRIMLFMSCILLESGKTDDAKKILEKIFKYINVHITDEEERGKIYPQCTWLLAEIYCEEEKYEKALEVCRAGKSSLVKNGSLMIMDRLLSVEKDCLKKLGEIKGVYEVEQEIKAIEFTYCLGNYILPERRILRLLILYEKKEIVVCNETLYDIRKAYNFSQEELSENVCSRETLSRIESGKRSPNKKNLWALFQKIGEERESCYSFVEADDYRIYEKVILHKKYWYLGEREKANNLLKELEEELDLSKEVNRQFIEGNCIIGKVDNKEISYEEAFAELEKVLRYTMKRYEGTIYRVPYREEAVILNCMALYLKRMGKQEEAIQLYEQLRNKYKNSSVLEDYHCVPLSLVYINYTGVLEVSDRLECAKEIGEEGLRLMVKCQRGKEVVHIIGNLSCIYEKKENEKSQQRCKEYMKQCYWLANLFNMQNDIQTVQRAYQDKFGEQLP